jgi:3-oxoacyl-[acyl-carrier protein] reductase
MDLGLANRACIITGASGGIGRAVAVALAREGGSLLLVGRRQEELARAAQEALEAGPGGPGQRAQTMIADITRAAAAAEIVEACAAAFGRVDVLVNNAGTSALKSWESLTDEDWQAQWELHVMAPMRLMRAAAPVMAAAGWGRIVNVSSSSGKRPSGSNMAYNVTKAAVLSLSRSVADLYASQGVLVNAVTPGPVSGDLWEADGGLADQQARAKGIARAEVVEQVAARVPLGRFGTPEEVAAVITFLCSEGAGNVAGAAWSVDGGSFQGII